MAKSKKKPADTEVEVPEVNTEAVKSEKPKIVSTEADAPEAVPAEPIKDATEPTSTEEQLDEEEREFRALRRDIPGVKGVSAAGIVSIKVDKTPGQE